MTRQECLVPGLLSATLCLVPGLLSATLCLVPSLLSATLCLVPGRLRTTLCPLSGGVRTTGARHSCRAAKGRDHLFKLHELVEMAEEPAVDFRQFENSLDAPAATHRLVELEDAVRARMRERIGEFFVVPLLRADRVPLRMVKEREEHFVLGVGPESRVLHLERTERLLEGLLERAADRHRLTDGLHLRAEMRIRRRELLEREARHLDDDVVERRLEAARRLARDVVLKLVERVADREKRRDLRDREARRL